MRWLLFLLVCAACVSAVEPMAATGRNFALYLADDGTVWAWGDNSYGQLGLGNNTPHYEPTRIPGLAGIVQISAGIYHGMALRADGTVFTWGYNGYGQIGTGSAGTDQLPLLAMIAGVVRGVVVVPSPTWP
jgi:alpha-tubulin suppressor-like RCC1 family protein